MKRQSGVLMHVSSLWGEYSEGALGREAFEWIDFLADGGFHVWQVLPFCIPDEYHSPYKSFGAFSLNPNFIDLPSLYMEGLLTKAELEAAKQKTPYACEFERLDRERFALLSLAVSRVKDHSAVRAFMDAHPETQAFCRYMAIREAQGNLPWNEWGEESCDEEVLFAW